MNKPWLKHYDPGIPPNLDYPADLAVHRLLEKSTAQYPDNTAVLFPALLGHSLLAGKLTFRQLDEAANRFANALIALGVKTGDRIAIHLPNTPQFVIAFYGAFKAGAIIIAFNPVYTAPEIERQYTIFTGALATGATVGATVGAVVAAGAAVAGGLVAAGGTLVAGACVAAAGGAVGAGALVGAAQPLASTPTSANSTSSRPIFLFISSSFEE